MKWTIALALWCAPGLAAISAGFPDLLIYGAFGIGLFAAVMFIELVDHR